MQVAETQVLQLPLDLPDAQAIGQGRENFQGFRSNAPLLLLGERLQGAHVVQAIGQFDQHHSHIIGHSQEHLAQALGLLVLQVPLGHLAQSVYLTQLCNPINQAGHLIAEVLLQILYGDNGVLHHIVKKPSRNGGGVQTQIGQDPGHSQGVLDIRLARGALLAGMSRLSQVIGPLDQLSTILGGGVRNMLKQALKASSLHTHFLSPFAQFGFLW